MRGLAPVCFAALLAACGTAEPIADASARDDAFVSRVCTWSAPPDPGVCDGHGRRYCEDWVTATTTGSALIAFSYCATGRTCAVADVCVTTGCTCGGAPECAAGSICAVRPGESVPSCIACMR